MLYGAIEFAAAFGLVYPACETSSPASTTGVVIGTYQPAGELVTGSFASGA